MADDGSSKVHTTCRSAESGEWTRKQKRHFQTLITVLVRMEHLCASMWWVTLTTAIGGEEKKLRKHERELRRRVEAKYNLGLNHYVAIDTTEGNGVLHLVWGSVRHGWIDHNWLSDQWEEIHGAPVVKILRYRRGSRGQLSRYMVSQYMAGQKGAGVRVSWSWWNTFQIPMRRVWKLFKREWSGTYRGMFVAWERYLQGETVQVGGLQMAIDSWRQMKQWLDVRGRREWVYA